MSRSLILLTVILGLLTAGCLGGSTSGSQPTAAVPTPIPPSTDLMPSQEPSPQQVPEPITAGLWATGLVIAFAVRRKITRPL